MIDIKDKIVYLSGPISNVDWEVAKSSFHKLHDKVEELGAKRIINPVYFYAPDPKLNLTKEEVWEFYMKQALCKLVSCDTIVLARHWFSSKGSRLERYVAEELGIPTVYEKNLYEIASDI